VGQGRCAPAICVGWVSVSGSKSMRELKANLRAEHSGCLRKMTPVGFEPTQLALVELESTPSDHSGKVSLPIDEGIHDQQNPCQASVRQQKAPKNNAWLVPNLSWV
jgi:hypothetical protein